MYSVGVYVWVGADILCLEGIFLYWGNDGVYFFKGRVWWCEIYIF